MKRFALAGLVVVACSAAVGVGIAIAMRQAEDQSRGMDARQIHLGFQNFDQTKHRLPQNARDTDGRLATSWRLELMPMLSKPGHDWDREQPWTAQVNSFHRNLAHHEYCGGTTNTRVFAFAKEMTSADGEIESRRLGDLPPATLLFLETPRDSDIHWMEPRDLTLDEALSPAMCPPGEYVLATFADGQIWKLTAECKNDLRRFIEPEPGLPQDERQRTLSPFGRWMNQPTT